MSTTYQFEDDGFPEPYRSTAQTELRIDAEIPNFASRVIGQEQAIARLRGVAAHYIWSRQTDRRVPPVLLFGPVGVGKTESVREVTEAASLPLVEVHLPSVAGHRDEIRSRALTGLLDLYNDREVPTKPVAVVLVDDLLYATPSAREELALVLRDPGKVSYRHRGAKAEMDLTGLLWLANLSYVPTPDNDHAAVIYRQLPPILLDTIRHRIGFRPLGREDLFRILESPLSPARALADALSEALGAQVDFSENALWTVVDSALEQGSGVRGLHGVLADLELRLWGDAVMEEHNYE
ncbi:MAG: AAA family ATPase [Methanoregulaceae archaeon]|nr:AAA family ATPase [Methanoregulaceae archaeon]